MLERLKYSSTSCCDIALIDQIIKDFIAILKTEKTFLFMDINIHYKLE